MYATSLRDPEKMVIQDCRLFANYGWFHGEKRNHLSDESFRAIILFQLLNFLIDKWIKQLYEMDMNQFWSHPVFNKISSKSTISA